jgi:hypothetical protein
MFDSGETAVQKPDSIGRGQAVYSNREQYIVLRAVVGVVFL